MTKRETRVIEAFLNCIEHGEFTVDYAITVIEDQSRYGWLSAEAKEYFYDRPEPEPEPEPEQEPGEPEENESTE